MQHQFQYAEAIGDGRTCTGLDDVPVNLNGSGTISRASLEGDLISSKVSLSCGHELSTGIWAQCPTNCRAILAPTWAQSRKSSQQCGRGTGQLARC